MRSVKIKFDLNSIMFYAMFLAIFRPEILSPNVRVGFRIILLAITLVYIILTTQPTDYWNAAVPISLCVFLSSFFNYKDGLLSHSNFLNGTLRALCIYSIYIMFSKVIKKHGTIVLLECLHRILFFYFVISLISIFIIVRSPNELYFFGSKYTTTYLLIFFSGIEYCLNEKKFRKSVQSKAKLILLYIMVFITIWYMGCMTGVVTYSVFFLLSFAGKSMKKILTRPTVVVICMIAALAFLLSLQEILQIGFVQDIITKILHKDLTLTDRLRYYNRAYSVIERGNIYWGYGYASDLMRGNIGLGTNLQNGLLQMIAEYGMVTVITLLISAYYLTKKKFIHSYWGIYMALYAFIIASMAEVSYSLVFYAILFLTHLLEKDDEPIRQRKGLYTINAFSISRF